MDFQEFLRKAREYESKKIKVAHIDIKDFGKVEFRRPTENEFLEYLEGMTAGKGTEDNDVGAQAIRAAKDASKKFVYTCCPVLQNKEVRDEYRSLEPYDIPIEIFGTTKTIELASDIMTAFNLAEESKKIEKDIKN